MPFTPFHMGPGILIKALLQGGFSLMVYGWSQILMDIQPLVVLLIDDGYLHGFSHTYIGATLVAVIATLSGKHLSEFGLELIGISKKDNPIKISWRVATLSAFVGTYTHTIFDGIMHVDVQPYYPFSFNNGLYGILSISDLHALLIYSAVFGTVLFFTVQLILKNNTKSLR